MEPQDEEKDRVREIIGEARSQGRKFLTEHESKETLEAYGIPTNRELIAVNMDEAVRSAKKIGFPVVLKVYSPEIIHKSDLGGVFTGLKTVSEVKDAYRKIMENVKANRPEVKVLGVLVEEMIPKGYEVIVGAIRDAQFGPAVMFGLGGVFTEVLKDVSFRLAPLSKREALRMIKEPKGFKILEGYRGERPADLDGLAEVIIKVGRIIMDLQEVTEIDVNPLIVHSRGLSAVDARIVLS
ncbi:MAG: acetate--CoA ligase family protein [Nitrososphaerota archaeon]